MTIRSTDTDDNAERFRRVEQRIETLELAHGGIVRQIEGNTAITNGVKADVSTVKADVAAVKVDVGDLKDDVGAVKKDVGAVKRDTGELVTLFAGMSALWKLLDYLGRIAAKITAVALAIGVMLAVAKFIVLDWMRGK